LLAVVKLECIEQSVGGVLGVPNNKKDKVDTMEVSHFDNPQEIPEHSVIFVLATAIIVDDINRNPGIRFWREISTFKFLFFTL
jgi:hypothetical protein